MSNTHTVKSKEKYPSRTPLDVIPSIKNYIINKSVCDIGCGSGDLLSEILRLGYSTKAIGIELHSGKIPEGRPYITCGNYNEIGIPVCDVYLVWLNDDQYSIVDKLPLRSTIVDLTSAPSKSHLEFMNKKCTFVEKVTYSFDETENGIAGGYTETRWPLIGQRNVFIYKKI